MYPYPAASTTAKATADKEGYGILKGELIRNFSKMAKKKTESLLSYYGFTASEQKKYPVISGILRELTPERIEKEIDGIKK